MNTSVKVQLKFPSHLLLFLLCNCFMETDCSQSYISSGERLAYKSMKKNFNTLVNKGNTLEEEIYSQSTQSNFENKQLHENEVIGLSQYNWSNKTTLKSEKANNGYKSFTLNGHLNGTYKATYLLGFSGNPFWIQGPGVNREKQRPFNTDTKDPRRKRSVLHLYNMVLCATGCNPLTYKGYGCYCGFLGSGYAVDGIDSCCQMHDRCYNTAGCPTFFEYFVPYLWKCYSHQPLCAIDHGSFGGPGSCAQRLCECDRQLAMCLRQFPCPNAKALCTSSPWRLLQNEKEKEKVRQEFKKMVDEEEQLLAKLQKEEAADLMRRRKDFVRRLELERREASLNGVVLKAQEVANLQKNQLEQEENLALELSSLRHKEIVDEKLRLQLRQNSQELKQLESQLKAAYVKKAIAAQLAEKEANKYEEELREKRAREIIEKAVGTQEEQEIAQRLAEKKQKDEFRHSLQDQVIEKEKLRQLEYMSFIKEKKIFDDIVQKIKEEEEKEIEGKKAMQEKLKDEMEQFYTARAMWRAKERLMIQEEESKIKEINEKKEYERENAKSKMSERISAKQEASDKLLKEFKEKQKKRQEEEEMISSLMRNEIEEKEKQKALEEVKKEIARREEARLAYKQILEEKTQRKLQQKQAERHFAEQMKLKIDEEDRAERAKQEKRRQQEIDNLNYNKQAVAQNVQKRAETLKLTQLINDLTDQEEARKRQMIQEERLRILKEHVPKLLGYFPKGCLREQDLEALGIADINPPPDPCPLETSQPSFAHTQGSNR